MSLELLDHKLTLLINSWNSPITDPIWVFFSDKLVWAPFYATVVGFLIWRFGWKKGLIAVLTIAFTILCIDQTCNFFKDLVARLRPCNDPNIVAQGLHILEGVSEKYKYGFFSGHSANAFGFALASVLAFKQDRRLEGNKWLKLYIWLVPVWAFLVAISRVFVGKHFVGDILVGFFAGSLIAYIIHKAVTAIYLRLAE